MGQERLIRQLTPDVQRRLAAVLLWFAITDQFFKGSRNICISHLRPRQYLAGLIDTLIGYWVVGIPAMFAFGYGAGWGSYGVWFGVCIGFAVTSVLLWLRFVSELRNASEPGQVPAVSI